MRRLALTMDQKDNVATAIADIPAGTKIEVEVNRIPKIVETVEAIPLGHKLAIRPISTDEHVVKYGEIIGYATEEIGVGELVHTHNVKSKRGRGDLERST